VGGVTPGVTQGGGGGKSIFITPSAGERGAPPPQKDAGVKGG